MKSFSIIFLIYIFISSSLVADDLARLDGAYARRVEQVLEPVNGKYLKALKAMKAKAMRNQDLDLANRVETKIKKFQSNPKLGFFQVLPRKIVDTEWHWHASSGSQFTLVFMKDGKAGRFKNGNKDKNWLWKVAGDDKSLELDTGSATYTVTFDKRFKVATRLKKGSSKPTKMWRVKIKR